MKRRIINKSNETITIEPGESIDFEVEIIQKRIMSTRATRIMIEGEYEG